MQEILTKAEIKKRTEKTGFFVVITNKEDRIANDANI
jgi:hypothetical protein